MDDKRAIGILKEYGCTDRVIAHILAVKRVAMRIAGEVNISVDRDLIRLGALFHDLGRSKTHGIDHALVGAEIARRIGLDERVVRIIERHIGAGITRDEAPSLGLPEKDYIPETPEEKIVSYADILISGDREISFERSLELVERSLGKDHPAIERYKRLHREIEDWKK